MLLLMNGHGPLSLSEAAGMGCTCSCTTVRDSTEEDMYVTELHNQAIA